MSTSGDYRADQERYEDEVKSRMEAIGPYAPEEGSVLDEFEDEMAELYGSVWPMEQQLEWLELYDQGAGDLDEDEIE